MGVYHAIARRFDGTLTFLLATDSLYSIGGHCLNAREGRRDDRSLD